MLGGSADTARGASGAAWGSRFLRGNGPGPGDGAYPACPCAALLFLSPAPWPPAGGGGAVPGWPGRVPRSACRTLAVPCRSPGSAIAWAQPDALLGATIAHRPSPGLGSERPCRRQEGVKVEGGPGEETENWG